MSKSSIYNGVCWDQTHKKWIAKIVINGKAVRLGYFDNEEIAYMAWTEYRDKYRPRQIVIDLPDEEWKPIKKFGGGYYVSNKGRIKNINFKRTDDERLLVLSEDAHGYYEVKRGRIHGKVHRLVLAAFIGESTLPVNHKDSNPKNNCLENLEYVTQRENVAHRTMRDTGYVGCHWDRFYKKWTARIRINGEHIFIGRFNNRDEAFSAYILKMEELGIKNKYVPTTL